MALALDFKIFGNGYGLKSPYLDDVFFWLVDTKDHDRAAGRGHLYNWIGGLGAQLRNRQWRMPRPGERRRLLGRDFYCFNARRHGLRVEAAWALVDLPRDLDGKWAEIRALKAALVHCDSEV